MDHQRQRRWTGARGALAFFAGAAIGLALGPACANAVELTQYFPAAPAGQTAPPAHSGWKIRWEILEPLSHAYGGSAVWEIQSVEFMKGKKADGSEDWIKILNNLALAEMFVPYHGGTKFYDISGFTFPFVRARADFLPSSGLIRGTVHDDGYVISEVADDQVRWVDNNAPGTGTGPGGNDKVQRGQALHLWATFYSGNYRYVLLYTFADDGSIRVRAGGTAENLVDLETGGEADHATHIHMPAWRMEFDLGNAEANKIEMVERMIDPVTNQVTSLRRPFNAGREGGEVWDPVKFSTLRITNSVTKNRHDPSRNVGYALKAVRTGSIRTSEAFTASDFWVSRRDPDDPNRAVQGPELKFIDVPQNVATPEPIAGKSAVVWHHASLNHIPRTEDFGAEGYLSAQGVAVNYMTGFDLVPVDLWHMTPFLNRGN